MHKHAAQRRFLMKSGTALVASTILRPICARTDSFSQAGAPKQIDALLQILANSPADRLMEDCVGLIRQGLSIRAALAALTRFAVENVQPWPDVGFKYHSVMVLHSLVEASLGLDEDQAWLLILWEVDYVRRQAAREASAGDWKLTDRVVVPVTAKNARQSLVEAIDEWDREAADYAVTQLLLEWTPAEVLQLLAPYSARDYRSIGHKVIAASNAYRMMVANDGFAASQLVRSLVIAITNSEGDPNPGTNDFAADRAWDRTLELSAGIRYPPSKTVDDWKAGSAILSSLRTVNDLEAVELIATAADRGLSEQVIWEALIASVGEQMLREGSFIAIHSNTMVDALCHLYSVSRDEISRRRIMLQAASLVANIRAQSNRARRKTRIGDYEAADPVVNLQEVFVRMGDSRIEAVSGALSFLDDGGDAEALIGTIRYYTLDRASNSHDFKYSEAVIKNYRYMRGPWKNRYLATAMLSVNGPHNRHNRIVNEGRELLSA